MKTIVTIDFDIIMQPSIEAYNSYAFKPWDDKIDDAPILDFCKCNCDIYQRLTNYLFQVIKKLSKEQIHIINGHHHILNYLPKEKTTLYNIDHHHDIQCEIDYNKDLHCENWVLEYLKLNNLNKYYWIHNENSKMPTKSEQDKLINQKLTFQKSSLEDIQPDLLILCLSPEWVPPYYYPLFHLWLDILNSHYDTHFDFED